MPSLKPWLYGGAALLLLGLVYFVYSEISTQVEEYGQSKYNAGYDAHKAEYSDALAEAEKRIKAAERAESEIAEKLQNALQKNNRISEELAPRIRDARFNCDAIGGSFIELYNAGSRAEGNN